MKTCNIMGVNVAVTNMNEVVTYLNENIQELKGKYICVSNVHTTVLAYENKNYLNVQNSAIVCLPDGAPLSKTQRKKGYKGAERVTGPSLMEEILKVSDKYGYRHIFYGSTQETLDKMKVNIGIKYPKIIDRCLFVSPPFKENAELETSENISVINDFRPHFIWIGLGAPKQENWMYIHKGMLDGVCIGVGAGFDYLAGNIKRAPVFMQKMCLEWLYRLFQNPKLFKRYLHTNLVYLRTKK